MRTAPKALNDVHEAVSKEQGGTVYTRPPEALANQQADTPSEPPIEADITTEDESMHSNMGHARGDKWPTTYTDDLE